jgi:bifunctional DNA-binding transcriptional regulator/antitoxin component of YhaV-PrlF toxin-antitoxin module
MTSTVSSKGQTVVPRELRERFRITTGTTLDWQEDGDALRVVKLRHQPAGGGLRWLRRLGRVPSAPRDGRGVERP